MSNVLLTIDALLAMSDAATDAHELQGDCPMVREPVEEAYTLAVSEHLVEMSWWIGEKLAAIYERGAWPNLVHTDLQRALTARHSSNAAMAQALRDSIAFAARKGEPSAPLSEIRHRATAGPSIGG